MTLHYLRLSMDLYDHFIKLLISSEAFVKVNQRLKIHIEFQTRNISENQFSKQLQDNGQHILLGYCYHYGIRVEANAKLALEYYLAKQDDSITQFLLGKLYRDILFNNEKAFEYYIKSANSGYARAQINVGHCYFNGLGTGRDAKRAFELFKANSGLADALINLGDCYEKGEGTDRNAKEAFEWYSKAEISELPAAYLSLVKCYLYGSGVNRNEYKALDYFVKAAEVQNASGQFFLAQCYQHGIGVSSNEHLALKWYEEARKNGHEIAQEMIESYNFEEIYPINKFQ